MSNKKTQAVMILEYIDEFGSITALDAMRDLGVYRLASRISDLKKDGYPIVRDMESVPTRYGKKSSIARYRLGGVTNGCSSPLGKD